MRLKRLRNFFRGWSDFFLTPAEVLFLNLGMYRLTRRILECHYADPNFRPWGKELGLAEICERTGRIREAEEHYQRVIRPGDVFGHLCLGDFYERQHEIDLAIQTYEKARSLSADNPPLAKELQERMEILRRRRDIDFDS